LKQVGIFPPWSTDELSRRRVLRCAWLGWEVHSKLRVNLIESIPAWGIMLFPTSCARSHGQQIPWRLVPFFARDLRGDLNWHPISQVMRAVPTVVKCPYGR
jgi:hypothetical protein